MHCALCVCIYFKLNISTNMTNELSSRSTSGRSSSHFFPSWIQYHYESPVSAADVVVAVVIVVATIVCYGCYCCCCLFIVRYSLLPIFIIVTATAAAVATLVAVVVAEHVSMAYQNICIDRKLHIAFDICYSRTQKRIIIKQMFIKCQESMRWIIINSKQNSLL